jgi:hypothetical protein
VLSVVRRVATEAGIDTPPVTPVTDMVDPLPLEVFLDRCDTVEALLAVTNNRQRTFPRGGILKAGIDRAEHHRDERVGVPTVSPGSKEGSQSLSGSRADGDVALVPPASCCR